MALTPVLYTNDLATALIACHVQCRRHYRESRPDAFRVCTGISHRQPILASLKGPPHIRCHQGQFV